MYGKRGMELWVRVAVGAHHLFRFGNKADRQIVEVSQAFEYATNELGMATILCVAILRNSMLSK